MDVIDIIADDNGLISYRPALNKITGSVTATILLQQMLYRFKHNGYKHFYKFKEPCGNKLYRAGDSWCEELGFTRSEFDIAIKKIAIKLSSSTKKKQHSKFVEYWITIDRVTYYRINTYNLKRAIQGTSTVKRDPALRKVKSRDRKSNISGYVTQDSDIDIDNTKKTISENTNKYIKEDDRIYMILFDCPEILKHENSSSKLDYISTKF